MSIIAAPETIEKLAESRPDVKIFVAYLDKRSMKTDTRADSATQATDFSALSKLTKNANGAPDRIGNAVF